MELSFPIIAMLAATTAASEAREHPYPSCDLAAQHALNGEFGGIKDAGQAHIAMRSSILQADIASARKAGRLNQARANGLWKRVETIGVNVRGFVTRQGFLSAAERATYDRQLDALIAPICRS